VEFPRGVEPGSRQTLPVRRFHEKPDARRAKRYLAAGNYYWNAGMFFWRADVLLDELRRRLPKTATLLASLPPFGQRLFAARLKEVFPRCENISIDFAVLEKSVNVGGIAADFGWNDVGSWNAVYELLVRDGHGNSIGPDSVCLDSHNNFVDARGKMVALLGVRNLIVVDTPDALLVASRDRAQQVGDVVKALEKLNREDLL
jgi:mannose-1-phosphate guanylyltransferase